MLERGKLDRGVVEMVDPGSLVPAGHLLRKIDAAVDFNRIYEMVESLYSEDNGRPSVDPVVLFKMVLIQHLYGLPSLRRTAEEVDLNILRYFASSLVQRQEAEIIQYLRKVPYTKDQPRRFPRFSVQLRHYTKNLEAHAAHQKFS